VSSAPNEIVPGPVARQVVANVIQLRTRRGWTKEALSERLTAVGRPIRATGLARLEAGKRRVDTDDLVALALAFEVSPVRLLMPGEPTDEVALTDERTATWQQAWRWATGEQPLDPRVPLTDSRVEAFITENRPFESTERPAHEVARWLVARHPVPFEAHVSADAAGRTKARISWTSGDDDSEEGADDGEHREAP
jgi:transcriptional regulator with XRE-family HTH domain